MFRISRVRIRWLTTDQHESGEVLKIQHPQAPFPGLWILNPRIWRVRVKWMGFGISASASPTASQTTAGTSAFPAARVLGTFQLPNARVRVRWLGLGQMSRSARRTGFLLFLGVAALMGFAYLNQPGSTSGTEETGPASPFAKELTLNGETIRIAYPQLDIGQIQDIFDQDTATLIRGLEANPFVLRFEFPNPRPMTGLVMDFGGMEFDLRIQAYGAGDRQLISYQGEYRNQPPEPHVELTFSDEPILVSRISIEIEQFNPPDEPHIHVREVLFRE